MAVVINEGGRRTPQYQMNGARRALSLGLTPPPGQIPTAPRAAPASPVAPTTTGPTPAPPTNYDALFRASIDRQRGAIDSQLRSAMGAIAQREAAANALVARQPGEVNAVYDQAMPTINQAAQDAAKTQAALNITPLAGDQAGLEPIKAALASARAGRLADLPYLQAGTQDLYQRQRGALEQAAMEARSNIEAQQQDYLQQQALQDRQQQANQDNLLQELTLRDYFAQRQERRQAKAAKQQEQEQLRAAEPPKGTAQWWSWYMRAHPNEAQSFGQQRGSAYAQVQRLMNQGEFVPAPAGGIGNVLSAVRGGVPTPGRQSGFSRKKLTLTEALARYAGPRYAKLRAALLYQASGQKKK